MTAARSWHTWSALVVVAVVVVVLIVLAYHPKPRTQLPRIVDEHGNNLLYVCPDDPRCAATVTTRP